MLQVFSPYDRHLIRELPMAAAAHAEQVLQIAKRLSKEPVGLTAASRIAILNKAASIMEQQVEALTNIAAEEGGKPYIDSKAEVKRAIGGVRIAADFVAHLNGEQIPMALNEASANRIAFTVREPIGVVFSISAFNHPLNLIVHQTATAIAAGCPVIVKPAGTTPLSCLAFVDILRRAGLPDGWCQPLVCSNEIAESIAGDRRVAYLSFIGSAKVGWYLRSKLAPGTRCALEHGGAAPVIAEPDADMSELIPALLKGGFYHAGQVCVSVQRVFVHENILHAVAEDLTAEVKKLKVGNPLDRDTEVGPLILPKEVDRVHEWVTEAVEKGARLLCGGNKLSETCYAPTVLLNPPQDARVSTMEVFGPVVCLYGYTDMAEAIRLANQLDLHFQAAVFTKNIDAAMACIKSLDASTVLVNDHTAFRVDWMPFGGRDASGLGLGGIPYSMKEMTREKLMIIKSPAL